jgi:cbb3-type cytochrome oxidase subunit 3
VNESLQYLAFTPFVLVVGVVVWAFWPKKKGK